MPFRSRQAASSSRVVSHTGRRNTAPMVARTVLGLQGSAHGPHRIRPSAPKASAERQMAPTFPGSCTPSNTRNRSPSSSSGGSRLFPLQRNTTPWGVWVSATAASSSFGTSTTRTETGRSGKSVSWVHTTVSSRASHRRASRSILGPSHRNTPSSRRVDRWLFNRRSRAIKGLLRLVIRSRLISGTRRQYRCPGPAQ